MKHLLFIFTVLTMMCILSCENNPPTADGGTFSATEVWHIIQPGTGNYADITMDQTGNGTITCTGNWYFDFYGSTITCTIMTGTVEKNGTTLSFSCSGNAAYPPDEDGYIEADDFTLQMSGPFSMAKGSGNWDIAFADEEWDEWAPGPGTFTATRTGGSGITDFTE